MPDKNAMDAALEKIALTRRLAVGALVTAGAAVLPSRPALASGSTNNVIYATSYGVVADGVTNDATALASAIAAMSNGYVLVLPAGTMALGSSGWTGILVSGLANIRIQGNATSIKWLATPSQQTGPIGATGLRLHNCTKAVVSDIAINGNGISCIGLGLDTCTSCTVDRVEAYAHGASGGGLGQFATCAGNGNTWRFCSAHDSTVGSAFRGYLLGNANSGFGETDLTIIGCSAQNNDHTGFGIEGVQVVCVGNLSENNKGAGFNSATANGSPATDHLFVGNIGRNNGFHGWQSDVWGPNAMRVVVTGNNFSGNTHSGVYVNKGTDIVISDNLIYNNGVPTGDASVVLNASSGVIVSNNIIEGESTYGICISAAYPGNVLSDVIIANNRCVGATSKTIWLEAVDGSSSFSGFVVDGNLVRGGAYGIYVRTSASSAVIDKLSVSNNIVTGTTSTNYGFIDTTLGQSTNVMLSGNLGSATFNSNVLPALNVNNGWNGSVGYASSAPSAGTWSQGAIIYNSAPVPGGVIGWVCTGGGTPGTWKTFGAIAT